MSGGLGIETKEPTFPPGAYTIPALCVLIRAGHSEALAGSHLLYVWRIFGTIAVSWVRY